MYYTEQTFCCQHKNKKATPVSTGKNTIDSSKLDMVNHAISCADCKAELGVAAHTVKNGVCTACSQKNFAAKSVYVAGAGYTIENEAKLNDDGSVPYEVILDSVWFNAAKYEYAIDEWNYKIPEAAMLEVIRAKYVMTDAQFAALKAQGSYYFFLDTHTYKDGYFYIQDPAAGGGGMYTHTVVGYTDNGNGKFTVYRDYQSGGSDVDEHEHIYYYTVEYQYSGYSNLTVKKEDYAYAISGYAPVVDSLRITAMKKVTSLPADMIKL